MSYYRRDSGSGWTLVAYVFGVVVYCAVAAGGGCAVEPTRFYNTLKSEGLTTPMEQGPYDFWECGYGDVWVSSFTAKRASPIVDSEVKGTVCCGLFKGCTVRWP